jgi:hypothetical protein
LEPRLRDRRTMTRKFFNSVILWLDSPYGLT